MSYDSTVEEFNLYDIFEENEYFKDDTTFDDDQTTTFDPTAELLTT